MSYITKQALLDELGEELLTQLTNDDGSEGVNDAVVDGAIAYGEGVFDSYVRTRYSVPVPSTPLVVSLNKDLAVYHLFKRRGTFAGEGVMKVRRDAFDDAVKQLKAIGAGQAALDVPATEETVDNPATGDRILSGRKNPIVTDSKLSQF